MDILTGLMTINGIDPYVEYGAFLAWKEGDDPMENYSALLTSPELKEQRKVDIREMDGVKLPAKLVQRWKEREVPLKFGIMAPNKEEFERRYFGFVNFLKNGVDGWLDVSIPELSRVWRFYLRRVTPYQQISGFEGEVMGMFVAVFEEPEPNF